MFEEHAVDSEQEGLNPSKDNGWYKK